MTDDGSFPKGVPGRDDVSEHLPGASGDFVPRVCRPVGASAGERSVRVELA